MTTWEQHDISGRGEADDTLVGGECVWVGFACGRVRRRFGLTGRGRRKTVDLLEQERVRADLPVRTASMKEILGRDSR